MKRDPILLVLVALVGLLGSPKTAYPQSFDKYGGLVGATCTSGVQSHFYVQKIGTQWWFCTPAGNTFWMEGVFDIVPDSGTDYQGINNQNLLNSKYATGITTSATFNWNMSVLRRLQAWHFNTIGEYSQYWMWPTHSDPGWPTTDHTPAIHTPYVDIFKPGLSSENNSGGYGTGYTKGVATGIKLSAANLSTAYPSFFDSADPFDANFGTYIAGYLNTDNVVAMDATGPNNDFFMGWVTDDSDNMGFSRCGPDFQSIRNGVTEGFPGSCAISFGYGILIHSPTQSMGWTSKDDALNSNVLYSDTAFYAKQAYSTWLQQTGDKGPGYLSIAALNTAWGSSYDAFGSDATSYTSVACATGNGTAGPYTCTLAHTPVTPMAVQVFVGGVLTGADDASGPTAASPTTSGNIRGSGGMNEAASTINYSSGAISLTFASTVGATVAITVNYKTGGWGSGHGFLDEDGSCPAKGAGNCWLPTNAYNDSGLYVTSALQTDMNNFLYYYAKTYLSTIKTKITAKYPGFLYFGPTGMGSWCAPPRAPVLQADSLVLDVITLNSMPCGAADDQARYDFVATNGGEKPWIAWQGWTANADSYMSVYPDTNNVVAAQTTQVARASKYQTFINAMLTTVGTSDGERHWAGFRWWQYFDQRSTQGNWGLVTPRDDPYDGVSTKSVAGTDAWGYPTGCLTGFGCEEVCPSSSSCSGATATAYGDFIDPVTATNALWYPPVTNVVIKIGGGVRISGSSKVQ